MPKSNSTSSSSPGNVCSPPSSLSPLFVSLLIPVMLGTVLYQLDSFDPVSYPAHVLSTDPPIVVPKRNNQMLHGSEKIGVDQLLAPEDVAYDPNSGVIYTGCVDGWVKKVKLNESAADSKVLDWVFTGGRPLGLAIGRHGEVIVADAEKFGVQITQEIWGFKQAQVVELLSSRLETTTGHRVVFFSYFEGWEKETSYNLA